MVRSISENGLTTLAKRLGNEPITIVEVDWAAGLPTRSYADRTVSGIAGKIIEVGALDNVVDVNANNNSQQINLTLDDTDGTIKAVFDKYDIHKRPVRIYQYFDGLALTDKFLVFGGKVNTPVSWNEVDRTVKITVVSQIEDMEVGFSAEEGDFPYLPADLVGKAWPMIFGTVQDCPALQVNKAVEACTLAGVGIITGQAAHAGLPLYENGTNQDQGQTGGNAMMAIQMGIILEASGCWMGVDDKKAQDLLDQYNAMSAQMAEAAASKAAQENCARLKRQQQIAEANEQGNGANPIPTVGGEDFPQNTGIWININGGSFYGQFQGNNFYISDRIHHEYETEVAQDKAERTDPCPPAPAKAQKYDYRMDVPCFCSDFGENCQLHKWGWVITRSSSSSTSATTDAIMRQFWADPGAKIVMESDEPLTYIASIVPGTVLAVKAFKQFQGPRDLVLVPPDLYTVQTKQYGTITTVEVVMNKPLSTIIDGTTGVNQGWSDDVYVTFQSSVGPDTIDIIKYLITNYTDLGWDNASFNRVQGQLRPFPANFPLLDRKNVIEVLKDIAFQARCAIWLADGKFYLKYLPEEPAADDTVTVSDLDSEQGVEVELTRTEDIVTKMNVKWRISYAPDNEYTLYAKDKNEKWIILRHNVARYGTQEKDYDWYIYNQPDIILKCATFWLIRLSNTWKRVKFRAFLNKLNLETFDTLLFDDRVNGVGKGYLASSPMKLVVEQASYNSADNYIDFQCLAPVRAGSVTQDPYFWPSVLPVSRTWPSAEDIASGNAGGGGIGSGASGDLPVGYTDGIGQGDTVFVGGPNVVFRPQSDWGDRTPTDAGFHAQSVVNAGQYAELRPGLKPVLHLRPTFLRDMPPLLVPDLPQGPVLDLSKTKVMDASTGDRSKFGYLRDVLSLNPDAGRLEINLAQAKVSDTEAGGDSATLSTVLILQEGELMIDGSAKIVTDDAEDGAQFDYQLDEDSGMLGAGTAFLQDD